MDVRIGVIQTAKELDIDLGDEANTEEIQKQVDSTLAKGNGTLWLTDKKGRKVGVSVEKIAYVEIGSKDEHRRVGFVG